METCNVIQHVGGEAESAQFLVSRGDDLGRTKEKKHKILLFSPPKNARSEGKRVKNYSLENENWWGERAMKKNDECKNQKLFSYTRKFISCHSRGSRAFRFAFNKIKLQMATSAVAADRDASQRNRKLLHESSPQTSDLFFLNLNFVFAWLKTLPYLDDVSDCLHVEANFIYATASQETRLNKQFFSRHDKLCFSMQYVTEYPISGCLSCF